MHRYLQLCIVKYRSMLICGILFSCGFCTSCDIVQCRSAAFRLHVTTSSVSYAICRCVRTSADRKNDSTTGNASNKHSTSIRTACRSNISISTSSQHVGCISTSSYSDLFTNDIVINFTNECTKYFVTCSSKHIFNSCSVDGARFDVIQCCSSPRVVSATSSN